MRHIYEPYTETDQLNTAKKKPGTRIASEKINILNSIFSLMFNRLSHNHPKLLSCGVTTPRRPVPSLYDP